MQELERAPFGQALALWLHRFPRECGSDWDWELERGFHLQILGPSFFELNLRPRESSEHPSLSLLPDASSLGVTRLLLWHKAISDDDWSGFAELLAEKSRWRAGLILSHFQQRGPVLREHLGRRALWACLDCPVVQIFGRTPPADDYFTVEKNLFCLGRVGRRLERYARWRRRLPW